jgi:molybdopterin-guanine dinucleotide biosynthesis protein A
MGRDKATLPFGAEVLLQRVVRLVAEAVDEVVVVARPGQELPELPEDVRVVRDEVPDQGPLGGLLPGLHAIEAPLAFVTACDVPFLRREVLDLLFERAAGHSVAVAHAQGFFHPLCAVYHKDVRPHIEALLCSGRLRPVFLFDEVPTALVDEDALRAVDPELHTLMNVNTPEAYEAALVRAFA